MTVRPLLALLGLAATVLPVRSEPVEHELNGWPFVVSHHDSTARVDAWSAAGPFLFRKPGADAAGHTASGFRPFWVRLDHPQEGFRAGYVLYPLFSYNTDAITYRWSVFELIRRWGRHENATPPQTAYDRRREFEIFPFWFSRESGDPDLSYRALFPIHGTIKNKLTLEHLSWTMFPFYVRNERRGVVSTWTPWPFLRVTRGTAEGWAFWPFYGYVERPDGSRHDTYLWPFGFKAVKQPGADAPPGTPPRRDVGVLPFYTKSTGANFINEDFLWPFFGYTNITAPKVYQERRYFWPFLMQGRGEGRYINRWAPFYSHSVVKGYDKRWMPWPLVRQARWSDDDRVERTRTQFLYFLYWNEVQRAVGRPNVRAAELTHIWPILSEWDNGAGRRQWQVFSPLDVFFPRNEKIKHAWSPFFALGRYERLPSGDERTSFLWNAITWERRPAQERSEFHLGPLLGVTREAQARRVSIGNGLFGFRRGPNGGWRMFWLDFPAKSVTTATEPR